MKAEHIAISERIAKHLETQMAQATDSEYGCRYRAPDGKSCAVGCLITDEAYSEVSDTKYIALEGTSAAGQGVYMALQKSGIEVDLELERILMQWQSYHDGRSGGPKYENWLEDMEGSISPTEFHQSLLS